MVCQGRAGLASNDDLLAYASWNRGVKGGGFNAPLTPLLVLAQPQGVVSSRMNSMRNSLLGRKS